ncbi:MAG: GNAT family N-acetyltransferase [Candidatus Poribacteria bacterium]|nr:GNAT family N-acetyltransferase [Candidatus Poribacteria bacterium]
MERSILNDLPTTLDDGMILRLATPDDTDAVAEFFGKWLHVAVDPWMRDLMDDHPSPHTVEIAVVEDPKAKLIVSATGFISQVWRYQGVKFPFGWVECVATHEDYRRRGYVRRTIDVAHAISASRGELMQGITGIPWYYRQFGYELAMPLNGGRVVRFEDAPSLNEGESEPFVLRAATENDDNFIRDMYETQVIPRQTFVAHRDATQWAYEFRGRREGSYRRHEWLVIESARGERVGYIEYGPFLWEGRMPINQIEIDPRHGWLNVLPSALRGFIALSREFAVTKKQELAESLLFFMSLEHPSYGYYSTSKTVIMEPLRWYIRIPDVVALLRAWRPALETNLLGTVAEGYTGRLTINFYRGGLVIEFERGNITKIDPWTPGNGWEGSAALPEHAFCKLICGLKRLDELIAEDTDIRANRVAHLLLDALFPPFTGQVWQFA